MTSEILELDFDPDGIISDKEIATDIVKEINPQAPHPSSPRVDVIAWKRIIQLLSPEVFTHIAEQTSFDDRRKCFITLSLRFDAHTPFNVSDLINVSCGPTVNNKEAYREHILGSYEYVLNVLPPVTAALVGSWLSQVRVFEDDYYKDEFLPEEYRWGGMNYPYRREIQIAMSCRNDYSMEYPSSNHSSSCTFLHEIGHIVHNIYGFYRPNDTGYEYPSSKDSRDSTGCLPTYNLSPHQSEFVYEMFRSYALHHRDVFEDFSYTGYCRTHPVEAFACAFEVLLRQGERKISEKYDHFWSVLRLME